MSKFGSNNVIYIPLTNRVRGPYRKLRTEFFPLRFMAQARSARAINSRGEKPGSVTYGTDREDEVSKIFSISLGSKRCGRFQSSETATDD